MQDGLTRRTVLAGAAGAAGASAGSLLLPGAGLAKRVSAPPGVFSLALGPLHGVSAALRAPRPFTLVGVEWTGAEAARIELRTRDAGGRWGAWGLASVTGHGPDAISPRAAARRIGDPLWTGPARVLQLRSSQPLAGVRLHFVSVAVAPVGARTARAYPLAQPVLSAGPGQPPIIARSAWSHGAPPSVPPGYGAIRLAFVHHTENPNGYSAAEVPALLLAIYQFHRFVRGWNDIGYNFVIDLFGRIWEARAGGIDQAVIGAQAGGYNAVSTGVAVLGSFTDVVPSAAAQAALERLLAWKLSLHGQPVLGHVTVRVDPSDAFYTPFRPNQRVSLPRVAGHRDGDSTDCPGDALYHHLPAMRPRIAALAGEPRHLSLAVEAPGRAAQGWLALSAPATVTLSGRLTELATGRPVAGQLIELQALARQAERTLATATTAADGSWSAQVTSSYNLDVRALSRSEPAVASDLAQIAVSPVLELSLVPGSSQRVTGTVSPSVPRVTLEVFGRRRGRRTLLAEQRVRVTAGRFGARLKLPRAGHYEVVAVTEGSARSAAARSAPLSVQR